MGSPWEITIAIIAMSFWVLFPIGMFLSVGRLDKETDQVVRIKQRRMPRENSRYRLEKFDWHHPFVYFRHWLLHDD